MPRQIQVWEQYNYKYTLYIVQLRTIASSDINR